MALVTSEKFAAPSDADGILSKISALPVGVAVDNIFFYQIGGEYYQRAIDGPVRASWFGALGNGVDHTAKINTALAHTDVKEIIFDSPDNRDITISGTVTIPPGKKLTFKGNNRLIGSGTVAFGGSLVDCDYRKQCFGTSLTVTGLGNSVRSVMWFGAVSDAYYTAPSPTDNYPMIVKCMNAGVENTKIYFPGSTTLVQLGNWYYCSSTLLPNYQIEIYGDGVGKSVILFNGNMCGIHGTWGSGGSIIHDIELTGAYQGYSNGFNSTTAHGILVNSNLIIERVRISNFDGDGIRFFANVGAPINVSHGGNRYDVSLNNLNVEPNFTSGWSTYWTLIGAGGVDGTYPAWSSTVEYGYSNCNNARLKDAKITGCGRYGVSTEGGDSNNITIENVDATGNAIANIAGLDFLGNYWQSIHTASASIDHGGNKTVINYRAGVSVGGNRYRAIAASTNQTPPNASYWALIGAGGVDATYQAWSSIRAYEEPKYYVADRQDVPIINIEPTVHASWSSYWTYKDFFPPFANEWDATTSFHFGNTGYYVNGINQLGAFNTCYAEQDQTILWNNSNNLFIGGYLGLYGAFVGALGMRLGFLTSQNFQAGAAVGVQLLPTGVKWKNDTTEFEFKGDTTKIDVVYQGLDVRDIHFYSPLADPVSLFGRDQNNNAAKLGVTDGIFLGKDDNIPYINLSAGTVPPTSGHHGLGDIRINVGAGSTLHWRCTTASVAGNGGAWTAVTGGGGTVTSVAGTTNRISSTGGATPIIDISASYVGQGSITTLGTIGTGVWNGTLVGATYGGTGVNNSTRTISIAGDLATTGAFNTTLAAQATVTTTLPPVATTLAGKTGTMAANYIGYWNDANQLSGSTSFKYDNSTRIITLNNSDASHYLKLSIRPDDIQGMGTFQLEGATGNVIDGHNAPLFALKQNNSNSSTWMAFFDANDEDRADIGYSNVAGQNVFTILTNAVTDADPVVPINIGHHCRISGADGGHRSMSLMMSADSVGGVVNPGNSIIMWRVPYTVLAPWLSYDLLNRKLIIDEGLSASGDSWLNVWGYQPILQFNASGVSQPITFSGLFPTTMGGRVGLSSITSGGLFVGGYTSTASFPAIRLAGHMGSVSPTIATTVIEGFKTDGSTGRTTLAAGEKVLSVYNGAYDSGTEIFNLKGDGTTTLSKYAGTGTRLPNVSSTGVIGAITNGSDGQVMTLVSGAPAWAAGGGSSTTINNNANNRVITGSGTANTLEGEAALTYDGSILASTATQPLIYFQGNGSFSQPVTFGGALPTTLAARIGLNGSTYGGLLAQGFTSNDNPAFRIAGHIGSATPTVSPIVFEGFKTDGADARTTLAAGEKVFELFNGAYDAGTSVLKIIGDGGATLGGYAGTGNRLTNFDANGKLVRGTIDPTNVSVSGHAHAAADITSGAFNSARLAAGTATDTFVVKMVSGAPTWAADSGGGTGDVVGPASAVDNRVAFFDGTTGKLIKDSGLTISGTNTGNQTITLTGDVTGSGTGTFAATITDNVSIQQVEITKNSGAVVGTRKQLNFIEGSNITLTIADDVDNDQVDITVASSGGASGYATIQDEGSSLTQRPTINIVGAGWTASDDGAGSRTEIALDGTLNALAAYNTNGFLTQTALDTFVGRTITGTAAEITATNGDGVSGNPTLSLPTALTFTGKTVTGGAFVGATLSLNDSDSAFNLAVTSTSTLTADRILTVDVNDAARTLTIAANATISGTNSGDDATNSQYSGLVTNATHTGDATGSTALTVVKINGVALSGLATGILKNTTTSGVPSIAVAGDFPTLNQSTTGSAATLTTPRAIYGNNFDGSAALAQIIASTYGGSGNGFTKFTGPATSEKTFTLPNADSTIAVTSNTLAVFAATTSAQLKGVISDETGTGGALVFADTPTLITPVLGVATATTINKVAFTTPATGSTLTIANGKTLTVSNTLTFTGTDSSSVAFGGGGTVAYTANGIELSATFAAISGSTAVRFIRVAVDETNNDDKVMYLHTGSAIEFQYIIP